MTNYLVNILNQGVIPWIHMKGPVYGISLAPGVYYLLEKDPRVTMVSTTREEAARLKAEYEAKKNKSTTGTANQQEEKNVKSETVEVKDEVQVESSESVLTTTSEIAEENLQTDEKVPIVETVNIEPEQTSEDDLAIDAALEANNLTSAFDNVSIAESSHEESKELKIYSTKALSKMTKAQLKVILRDERGYTVGPNAPKYHDSLAELIEKVKKTQKK